MRWPFVTILALFVISLTSCDETSEVTAPLERHGSTVQNQWLTSDVQNALDPNGQFLPNEVMGLNRPTISRARARDLAFAWAQGYGMYVRNALERHHGAPIIFEELEVAERVFLLDSSHEPLPAEAPNPVHKAWGPYYLVTLEQDGVAAVEVAVSVYADDIVFDGVNRLWYVGDEGIRGNEFRWAGLHPSPAAARRPIVTPEQAVALVRAATGARVAEPPSFFRRGPHFYPAFGSWRISLDRNVMAKTERGEWESVRQVFVDARGWVGIPSPENLAPIPPSYGQIGPDHRVLPDRSQNAPPAIAPATFLPIGDTP